MKSIIYILSGNDLTAGPMAASYLAAKLKELQDTVHEIHSAGLLARKENSVGQGARAALAEKNVPLLHVGATPMTYKELRAADLVLCLNQEIRKSLTARFHFEGPKAILLMSLLDSQEPILEPKSGSVEANRACLAKMIPALDILAQRIAQ
jgi:protein-tyrosine-phosphatase